MSIRNSKVWLLTFIMIWAWSTTSLHAASVPGSSTSCHCWTSYWGNSANSSAFSLLGGFQTGGFPNPLVICGWTGQSLFQWPSFSQYTQWFGSNCPLPVSPAAPTPSSSYLSYHIHSSASRHRSSSQYYCQHNHFLSLSSFLFFPFCLWPAIIYMCCQRQYCL